LTRRSLGMTMSSRPPSPKWLREKYQGDPTKMVTDSIRKKPTQYCRKAQIVFENTSARTFSPTRRLSSFMNLRSILT
jgi:hypothetical protein